MNIYIVLEDDRVNLILRRNEEIVDDIFWKEDRNLSQRLLVKIDKLLKKNNLNPCDIRKMEVKTKIPDKFTTVRIAKIVTKTFNFLNKLPG